MSSSKKGLLSLAIIALLGAGWYRMQSNQAPPAKPVKVALVTGGSGPFWQLVASGARDAAEKNEVTLELALPKEDENVSQQTELLEKLSASKFDGVAVSPLDAQGQTELLAKIAGEANMVTYDSDAPESPRLSYIGMNNARAGRLAAILVREACPDGGKLAVIFANLTKDNLLERKRGFEEAMGELAEDAPADAPKYEVVAQLVSEGSNERCAEVMKQTLTEHPDLKCFVGMNAQHGPVMVETLKAENQLGKIAIVAFDEDAATLDGIEAGNIIGSVMQDPYEYGFQSVRLLAEYARGDDTLRPVKGWSSTLGVTPTAVKKESLAEFREYLAKHLPK